jgi:hypothetical protein
MVVEAARLRAAAELVPAGRPGAGDAHVLAAAPTAHWGLGQAIIAAILAGERFPGWLAKLRDPRIKAGEEVVAKSLEGNWRPKLLIVLKQESESSQAFQKKIAECDVALYQHYQSMEANFVSFLDLSPNKISGAGGSIPPPTHPIGCPQSHNSGFGVSPRKPPNLVSRSPPGPAGRHGRPAPAPRDVRTQFCEPH